MAGRSIWKSFASNIGKLAMGMFIAVSFQYSSGREILPNSIKSVMEMLISTSCGHFISRAGGVRLNQPAKQVLELARVDFNPQ